MEILTLMGSQPEEGERRTKRAKVYRHTGQTLDKYNSTLRIRWGAKTEVYNLKYTST